MSKIRLFGCSWHGLNSFIERVDIYEQEQLDGRFLEHIKFRFPVCFNGKEIEEMS